MDYAKEFEEMNQLLTDAIEELDLFLGPDTPARRAWEWCNADRRPTDKKAPAIEDLMEVNA